MATGHLDKRTVKREGWFQKQKDANKPKPNYIKECKAAKKGYLGPRMEVHHILPQTSIEESVLECGKDIQYVTDVQYITPWNINSAVNLIGLPHYHAYDLYYQGRARLAAQVQSDKIKDLVSWFNSFASASRSKWLRAVFNVSPEGYPIHNPVNWGHTVYNSKVKTDLTRQVWHQINDKKKKHEFDAKTVEGALNDLADVYKGKLEKRGAKASQKKWDQRVDRNNDDWHAPFTMADVPNPIFG